MIVIRPATTADSTVCSHVLCASIRELCAQDHGDNERVVERWTSNKRASDLGRWIADDSASVYVAESEGVVCGVGAIGHDGEVTLNYVSPEHRFKGVSKAMLRELETALRGRGVATARLESTETAHRFYENLGWQDAGEPETWLGMKGYPMEKKL